MASIDNVSLTLVGYGTPCVITVDSSATTGRFSCKACLTSGWICNGTVDIARESLLGRRAHRRDRISMAKTEGRRWRSCLYDVKSIRGPV